MPAPFGSPATPSHPSTRAAPPLARDVSTPTVDRADEQAVSPLSPPFSTLRPTTDSSTVVPASAPNPSTVDAGLSNSPPAPSVPRDASIAGVHFAGQTATAAQVFGAPELDGWAVELAYTDSGESAAAVAARVRSLRARGFRPILRLDAMPGQNIPAVSHPDTVGRYVDFASDVVARSDRALAYVVVGNEPNIDVDGADPARHTECRSARADCSPAAYARVYRDVRAAVRPLGAAAIVAGVSPGTADHPARWMGGPDYLAAVLAELAPGTVDGIALHAYGLEAEPVPGLPSDRLAYFQALVERQLEVIDAAGHETTPLYLTEMNEYDDPDATFVRAAYRWLDERNASRRGDIMAAVWFVWNGGGTWDDFALEHAPADVRAAFAEVAHTYSR
jgi:hypothetical protein